MGTSCHAGNMDTEGKSSPGKDHKMVCDEGSSCAPCFMAANPNEFTIMISRKRTTIGIRYFQPSSNGSGY